jgi:type IV pilus assembly protein PilC
VSAAGTISPDGTSKVMSTFSYTAVDPMGRAVKGSLDADNEQVVLTKLHEQKFHVVSIKSAHKREGGSIFAIFGARGKTAKAKSVVMFSRQFATMINAGISLVRCLDILENQTTDLPLKSAISQVKRDVKEGATLSEALSKHPAIFTKLYVNMVKAAEIGGILDKILDRLAGFLESEMEIKQKVKAAMMYPAIVLIFAGFVLIALFTLVLPKFKEIFNSLNVEMPPATAILFSMSEWMTTNWWVVLLALAGIVFGYKHYSRTTRGRYNIDALKLKAPVFGDIVLKVSISRFTRTFATLLASGVPMMRSLEIIGDTSGNMVIANAISSTRSSIREGQKISQPLAQSNLFPPMVIQMIDVGEETGLLSEMLAKVSDFYDHEVESVIKGLTSLIEPLLIVFLGSVVGFIAISVMAPIFKLVSSIH